MMGPLSRASLVAVQCTVVVDVARAETVCLEDLVEAGRIPGRQRFRVGRTR